MIYKNNSHFNIGNNKKHKQIQWHVLESVHNYNVQNER